MKQFYENFPEFNNLEKEKKRFVNRLNQIFREVEENCSHEELLQLHVNCCFSTGEDIDIIRDRKRGYLTLKDIADNSYEKSLLIIIEIFKLADDEYKAEFNKQIVLAISYSNPILGINWVNGMFYPSGDSTLDKELIAYSSFLLEQYPAEQKDLHNALSNYKAKKYDDVLHHCFTCLEDLTRKLLNNKRALTKNKEELLAKLEADQNWKSIINRFFEFLNDYGRHGGAKRHEKKEEEVEAALYQTCLLVRMIMRKIEK